MSPEPNPLVPQDRPEPDGYGVSRWNALRHGVLSQYTVLPWESEAEYHELLNALVQEHQPHGPIVEHLVEELAGILWHKCRLCLAEAAAHRHGLASTVGSYRNVAGAATIHTGSPSKRETLLEAISSTAEDATRELADLAADETRTREALAILKTGTAGAYEQAPAALREETRGWWQDALAAENEAGEDEEPYRTEVGSLERFLRGQVLSWYEERRKELEHRPLIQSQAFGEALEPKLLEPLARYEAHLDRKLGRTLSMLIRLREVRASASPD